MDLPKLDLSSLPDLDTLAGMFGSAWQAVGHDDTIVILGTFFYEASPGIGSILP